MESIDGTGLQGLASTTMLKKSLDFQASMASSLLSGATQGSPASGTLRTDALQEQGKAQTLNTTV